MSRTVTRLFDNYADAERAFSELERMGIFHRDISLVASNADKAHDHRGPYDNSHTAGDESARDAGKGATTGGVIGGVGGLLAIPGLGPVVAAGWLASTVVGAGVGAAAGGATGGLIGALKHAGETDEDVHVYAEGVRRGGRLVSAKVDDSQAARVESTLNKLNAVDAQTRGGAYRQSGWTSFDDQAPAYSAEQVTSERARY